MDVELIIAAILICTLGLPHGALDPWVAWRSRLFHTSLGLLTFLVSYVALCVVGLGGWYLSPTISLTVFLGYSAVHFGRDQAERCDLGGAPYGLIIIGAPALFRPDEVRTIYASLTSAPTAWITLEVSRVSLVLGLTGLIYSWWCTRGRDRAQSMLWLEVSALLSFAYLLTPLWYFVIFFCGLHSPRHLARELRLATPRQRLIAFGVMGVITLITVGLTFMVGAHLRVQLASAETFTYQAIFIGLSVLTVPHMCLMEWERARAPLDSTPTKMSVSRNSSDQSADHMIS